jgi:hypothetical protein
MPLVTLNFVTKDDGLALNGTANFARQLPITSLRIAGLADWRHAPANVIHVNQDALTALDLPAKAKNLSKVGLNYIGIKAKSNIMLSFNVRQGKNGVTNVKNQLTKFFKALGATSVKFTAVAAPDLDNDDSGDDNND